MSTVVETGIIGAAHCILIGRGQENGGPMPMLPSPPRMACLTACHPPALLLMSVSLRASWSRDLAAYWAPHIPVRLPQTPPPPFPPPLPSRRLPSAPRGGRSAEPGFNLSQSAALPPGSALTKRTGLQERPKHPARPSGWLSAAPAMWCFLKNGTDFLFL